MPSNQSSPKESTWLRVIPYLLIALTVLLFYWRMAFTDLILARGDTFLYFYPNWQFASDALRAGRLPQWNPHIFMGAPFIANSQVGFYYPFNWPLWLLFEVPTAVKITILGHLIWAGWGTYRLARAGLKLDQMGATFAGLLFPLGGYLSAQVEHVNQLQGLAWLPWLLLIVTPAAGRLDRRAIIKRLLLIGLVFGLQITAGHTQSLFITGIAAGLWVLFSFGVSWWRRFEMLFLLAGGGLVGLGLAAAQLLPTLELTGLSSRQGGLTLNEVLSFSWHPLLLAQSMLPFIGQPPFTEYVAFLPASVIVLATFAALTLLWPAGGTSDRSPQRDWLIILPLMLVAVGLFLALGRFNLVSQLYSRLPGFNLFRVPARWLILYGLGMSLLAGKGLMLVVQRRWSIRHRLVWLSVLPIVVLIGWGYAAGLLTAIIPQAPESPYMLPSLLGTAFIIFELLIGLALIIGGAFKVNQALRGVLLIAISGGMLFAATRYLPYHNLTTPEAYFDKRSPALRLLVKGGEDPLPGRFLSLSQIFFDPGDQAEIDTIYADHLTPTGAYDYTIAIKLKEIVAPNMPMVRGLYAADGFDGGILPLRSYSEFVSETILDGRVTTDGRLREFLEEIPDAAWLDRMGVRFVITDKVGDVWLDGVFFDRQHQVDLVLSQPLLIGYLPPFEADHVELIFEGDELNVVADGESLPAKQKEIEGDFSGFLWQVDLGEIDMLESLAVHGNGRLSGISLVNRRDETFVALVPGQYRQIYSGDVKIYENLDVWDRVVLLDDSTAGLSNAALLSDRVEILESGPERMRVETENGQAALLLFAEAHFPGWEATINGEPADILIIDDMFNGVLLDVGENLVEFRFESASIRNGILISLVSLFIGMGLLLWTRITKSD